MISCSSIGRIGRLLLWLSIASASMEQSLVVSQQPPSSDSTQQPLTSSCYSGIAVLKLISPDANTCVPASAKTRPLTSPMDFSTDLPWDCLNDLTVSVSGCKVSIISNIRSSAALPDFACNWIEYQGYVQSDNKAHLAAWVRPISTARWILYNTNITSWRAVGTATITFDDLQKAIKAISIRDPGSPVSSLLDQPEMLQLQADASQFQQQQQQQQQLAAASGGRRLSHGRKLQQQPDAAALAAPATSAVAKPPLPPGVEADVGNGLVSRPIDWQKRLADGMQSNGSMLFGFPDNNTVVLYNNERCNITYEVTSGGLLGAGNTDSGTVGTFAMPSITPFQPPMIIDIDRQVLAAAAAVARSNQDIAESSGDCRALRIFFIVFLCVLGAALIGALGCLAVRLSRAPKAAAAAAAAAGRDDLVLSPEGVAMSPLEQQARALGPSGGL